MKILILFLLIPALSLAQSKGDSKIIITVNDTTGIYEKVRLAFVNADFVVKDLNRKDSIVSYPRKMNRLSGVSVANANIQGNTVELSGYYVSGKTNYFGTPTIGKDAKPIYYYKGSRTWPLLEKIAKGIGGKTEYLD